MRIGGYSYNIGPGKMIDGIGKVAREETHEFVGLNSQQSGIEQIGRLRGCDVVLLGASTNHIYEEINMARRLYKDSVPYVFVEDVNDITTLISSNDKDVQERSHGRIVAFKDRIKSPEKDLFLGPPDHWREAYELMTGAKERRKELTKDRGNTNAMPIGKDDVIVCVPGIKGNPEIMNNMIELVRDTATKILGKRLVMAVNQHPGEAKEATFPQNKDEYEKLLKRRKRMLGKVWSVSPELLNLPDRTFLNPEIIGASDITVFAGKPTDAVVAAFARKPNIYYSEFLEKIEINGTRQWFLAETGGTTEVEDAAEMPGQMQYLLSEKGYSTSLEEMEKSGFNVPQPDEWHTSQNIVRVLPELIV